MRLLFALLAAPACMAQTNPFLVRAAESGEEPALWIFAVDRAGVRYEFREFEGSLKTRRIVRPDGTEIRTFDNERLRSTRKGEVPEPFGEKCHRAGDVLKGEAEVAGYHAVEVEHVAGDQREVSFRAPELGCVALRQKRWVREAKRWEPTSSFEATTVREGELPLWLPGVYAGYKEVSAAELDAAFERVRAAVKGK